MTVRYHPAFAQDIRRLEADYQTVSVGLAARFRSEVDEALALVQTDPLRAGHFLRTGSSVVKEYRRRNLCAFPFFVLHGVTASELLMGSLVPSRSDPLTWLPRFGKPAGNRA
jgi:hypothetical protein